MAASSGDADRWRALFYQVLLVGGAACLALWLLVRLEVVTVPVFIGLGVAYVLRPLVRWLRRHRLPGVLALAVPVLLALGLLLLAVFVVGPRLVQDLRLASRSLPDKVMILVNTWAPRLEEALGVSLSALVEPRSLQARLQDGLGQVLGTATSLLGWVWTSARDLVLALFNAVVILVVAAFMIDDFDSIVGWFRSLVPRRWADDLKRLLVRIDETMAGFLRGQLLLLGTALIVFTTGLALMGLPFAFILGPLAAVLYLVPYVGVAVGAIFCLLVVLLELPSWGMVIAVVSLFGGFNAIDGLFITPRLIGSRVGLRPLLVLLGIIAGGELFGIVGVLLAVPTLAVLRIVLLDLVERYRHSRAYLAEDDDPSEGREPDGDLRAAESTGCADENGGSGGTP
jgi:predicted PurR-regulated permease PerM